MGIHLKRGNEKWIITRFISKRMGAYESLNSGYFIPSIKNIDSGILYHVILIKKI
jgi:hypothetical protein